MNKFKALLPLVLSFTLIGCNNQKNDDIIIPEIDKPGTVMLLATGGTIAGSGEEGKETGYKPGSISVESLIASVPGIEEIAPLQAIQVCNINSDDITSEIWVKLAKIINQFDKDPNVAGTVILHGTDTMEETAYFLNLTVDTDKPVVITGSMRPATSLSPDGPMNLYQSVVVAASEEAIGKGVLGVFSDSIYTARSMQKTSTFDVTAISGGTKGAIGIVRNDQAYFYEASSKKHTKDSDFRYLITEKKIDKIEKEVPIIYFEADADPDIIDWAKNKDGIVVAGAGAGEFSKKFTAKLNEVASDSKPVVISSRINSGLITQDSVLVKKAVAANDLPPNKAAILLRLAMQANITAQKDLMDIFAAY